MKQKRYTQEQRQWALEQMKPPHNRTVVELARESGVTSVTLRTWRNAARAAGALVPGAGHARDWVLKFVHWYNEEHRHSGLKYVTPAQRHTGQDRVLLDERSKLYAKARTRHPQRWASGLRDWHLEEAVYLNPERLERDLMKTLA